MLEAVFIRKIVFPRSAALWVLLDRDGLRREVLERGEKQVRRVGHLERLMVNTEQTKAKYPILLSAESLQTSPTAPAWLAFDTWLAEMIDIGLAAEDPHPELFEYLNVLPRSQAAPTPQQWGQAALKIAAIFGIWTPPRFCACKNPAGPHGSKYFCGECITTIPDKFMTVCGDLHVPLALLLDDLDSAFTAAFDKPVGSANFVRELGKRGLLHA